MTMPRPCKQPGAICRYRGDPVVLIASIGARSIIVPIKARLGRPTATHRAEVSLSISAIAQCGQPTVAITRRLIETGGTVTNAEAAQIATALRREQAACIAERHGARDDAFRLWAECNRPGGDHGD